MSKPVMLSQRVRVGFQALLDHDDGYARISWWFLRALAVVYFAAFLSAALEIEGLVGQDGILPADRYLDGLHQRFGDIAWLRFPTLFWLAADDGMLLGATYLGCLLAVLLLFGWRPLLTTIALFVLYLSLTRVGQLFFNFQWDYLLLETGFLAIFLTRGPNRLLIFLVHWLLFRLRFLSGLSKLQSGDPSWSGLTTLQHYFETQPLPHIGSWYAHHLPEPLLRAGTGATLFIELIVPFFIFLPRPFRLFAAAVTIGIQLLIIATSNHNFINLLTIALCLFLLDDRALPGARARPSRESATPRRRAGAAFVGIAAVVFVGSSYSAAEMISGVRDRASWYAPAGWLRAYGIGHVYHVFPNMQTERHELMIEGSDDGRAWQRYRFKFKPNDVNDRPAFIVPLHARLDWMIWFIPPQHPGMRGWFDAFVGRLHQNSPAVTSLLADNPFSERPPRYLRVLSYRYRFTTPEERAISDRIWQAELLGEFPHVPRRQP